MPITFDDHQVVSRDNVPYVMPRDANYDPMGVLGGFDASNTFRFATFTDDGKLKVDASISVEHIDIGDVNIQVVGPLGNDLLVAGDYVPGTTQAYLLSEDPRMHFTGDSLDVNITASALPDGAATEGTLLDILEALGGGSSIDKISRHETVSVAYNTPTTVLDYMVPVSHRFRIDSLRGWADVDAEFAVLIDALQVDGYRTTPANLTMDIENASIQYATAGQHVTIVATHFKNGPNKTFNAVLQGALEVI